jgi:hypothetical protein
MVSKVGRGAELEAWGAMAVLLTPTLVDGGKRVVEVVWAAWAGREVRILLVLAVRVRHTMSVAFPMFWREAVAANYTLTVLLRVVRVVRGLEARER